MVPGSVTGSKILEGDVVTSSVEQRTRTFEVAPAARVRTAGPAPGDVLKNRFVLHQCLADGSTSRLFRALDRRRELAGDPDPWVVLKVVTAPPGHAHGEPRALQALRREAAIAQGLEHPNLPRIIGIDHDGPHTFVCMAWLEGESLAAILDSRGTRPMTRVQALQVLDGVGRALCHLHAQGIIHADVKPGNILVTAQGNATLLDFGVAVGPGAGDLPAVRGFTPEYASPEVLAGHEPTPSDDLFSLACVAYRMLAGHRAFGPVTAGEAAAAGNRPARPEHLSPAQWRGLDRALSFARQERQPDIAAFLAQLKGARDESLAITDLAGPEPGSTFATTQTARPAARGGRVLLRPAAVLVAMAAAVAGAAWMQRVQAPPPAPVPATMPAAMTPEQFITNQSPPPAAGVAEPQPQPPAIPDSLLPAPPGPTAAAVRAPVTAARPRPARAARIDTRTPPAELAGPPLPEPDETSTPVAPSAGALADTTAAAPSVPFSSLTVRRYVDPAYPRNAAARRVPGWVDVAFTVEPSGKTRDVRVIAADPPGTFDEAALAAVRRWRFADVDGDGDGANAPGAPVNSQIRVRFDPR